MGRVEGKVAIVTGAARGMGASHAEYLVREGAQVVLTDLLDEEGEHVAAALGSQAAYLHHDVTSEAQWQDVVARSEARFGPVSVLVNNAGIAGGYALESLEESFYRRVIDVNQVSVFLGMKSVVASMRRAGGGSIINISSASGLVGLTHTLAYTASKFAVRGMTKTAAIELAKDNIRVNSIHPGMIRTELTKTTPENAERMTRAAALTPAGRIAEPGDVSSVVLLLASDESTFSTGAEFVVDGGMTCQ